MTETTRVVTSSHRVPSDPQFRAYVRVLETVLMGMPQAEQEGGAREYAAGVLAIFRVRDLGIPEWLAAIDEPLPDDAR